MSASNLFESGLQRLIFQNAALPNIGDAAGLQPAATAGSFYLRLHTADPGETGSQSTSEATYGGYAAVAVPRTSAGWTEVGGVIQNAAVVAFPVPTSGAGQIITHFSIGTDASGSGNLLFKGPLNQSHTIVVGTPPSFAQGQILVPLD